MSNESLKSWHLWFFLGGIASVVIGVVAHETALADALARVLTDREVAERLAAAAHASADFWTSSPEEFALRVRALVERIAGLL